MIRKLFQLLEDGRAEYEKLLELGSQSRFAVFEAVDETACGRSEFCGIAEDQRVSEQELPSVERNSLVRGDNLAYMIHLLCDQGMAGKVDLIYIDPPFYSKADYGTELKLQSEKIKLMPPLRQKAYQDTWENGMEGYLSMLTVRLFLMKDLLKDTGSIWVHLDWHVVHYVKVLMDEIFGEQNFVNEVIWNYKSGGVSKNHFARKHDTLLFYGRTKDYFFEAKKEKSYNRGLKPYRFKGVSEYQDEVGWYTMVNRKDVWQLDMVGRTSAERTGYATQKPEALIARILESCTKEGDLCADFFGGSGTLACTANRMGRRFLSCDVGGLAVLHTHKRLISSGARYCLYEEEPPRDGADQEGGSSGKIHINIAVQVEGASDKMRLTAELRGYEPKSFEQFPVEQKYFPVIEEIIKEDPLQLVDYWSMDLGCGTENCQRDDNYRPQVYFCREKNRIEVRCERSGFQFGRIRVHIVDIFGNSSFCEVVPEYQ